VKQIISALCIIFALSGCGPTQVEKQNNLDLIVATYQHQEKNLNWLLNHLDVYGCSLRFAEALETKRFTQDANICEQRLIKVTNSAKVILAVLETTGETTNREFDEAVASIVYPIVQANFQKNCNFVSASKQYRETGKSACLDSIGVILGSGKEVAKLRMEWGVLLRR
jgi:hypothetical protein